MGDFAAGKWITLLLLYFFTLFVIVNYAVTASMEYGIETDAHFADPGFGSEDINISTPNTASAADTASMSSVKTSLSVITGINAGNVGIGLPAAFIYIFSFLFFWIEFFMLLWALYMAIPFFH